MADLSPLLPFIVQHPLTLRTTPLCQILSSPLLLGQLRQQLPHQPLAMHRHLPSDFIETRRFVVRSPP